MLKDNDPPKEPAAKVAERKWRNNKLRQQIIEAQQFLPSKATDQRPQPADLIENEGRLHGSMTTLERSFIKHIREMLEGHVDRNLMIYAASLQRRKVILLREKLRRLRLAQPGFKAPGLDPGGNGGDQMMLNQQYTKEEYARTYAAMTDQELDKANVTWSDEQASARRDEVYKRQRRIEQERERAAQERAERLKERKEAVTFTDAIASEICERIASGELLTVICLDPHMPTVRRCNAWLREHVEFRLLYGQSLEDRLSIFEEDLVRIPDEAARDFDEVKVKGSVKRVIDPGKITVAKLRVEVRRLHLKAGKPAKWGDSAQIVVKSGDEFDTSNMSAEQLEHELAELEFKSRGTRSAA